MLHVKESDWFFEENLILTRLCLLSFRNALVPIIRSIFEFENRLLSLCQSFVVVYALLGSFINYIFHWIFRYKRLLCMVDLTKDFFFSYSYHIMRSLQRNICENETGHVLYETMFVWNEFLTRGIRNHLQNTIWTVALVYGFFKQVKISYTLDTAFIDWL